MFNIFKGVYHSYRGDGERHWVRLVLAAVASFAVAYGSSNLSTGVFPSMALAVTVLAGFSFTALFSSHALTVHDLPKIQDENDRNDINLLKDLSQNFRIRSRYFFITAVADLLLIILAICKFEFNKLLICDILLKTREEIVSIHANICYSISTISASTTLSLSFIAIFVFLEGLYTFYRLSETIMAVIDIRNNYLQSRFES